MRIHNEQTQLEQRGSAAPKNALPAPSVVLSLPPPPPSSPPAEDDAAQPQSATSAGYSTKEPGSFVVTVPRLDGRWGISVMGTEVTPHPRVYVAQVVNPAAAQSGLVEGCRILCVDGRDVRGFSHAQVVHLLSSAGDSVDLEVVLDKAGYESLAAEKEKVVRDRTSDVAANETQSSVRNVTLVRGAKGFGFRLAGPSNKPGRVYISQIVPGGVAAQNGNLREGDCILAINNVVTRAVLQSMSTAQWIWFTSVSFCFLLFISSLSFFSL